MPVGDYRYIMEVLKCTGWEEIKIPADNIARLRLLGTRSSLDLEDRAECCILLKPDGTLTVYKYTGK
jgi:hypothetical protein